MPSAKDIPLESRLFAFFVGDYDGGKSTAAASFPGRKFIFEFDGRIAVFRGRDDIDFEPFNTEKTGFAEADAKMVLLQAYGRHMPYNMVIFDSVSLARRLLLYDAMKWTSGKDDSKAKGRKIGNLYLPTTQDYGYEAEAIWQLIIAMKELPCHVVVTGHTVPKIVKKEGKPGEPTETIIDGKMIYGDPKLMAVLPTQFNEIYEFRKQVDATGKERRFVKFSSDVARTTYPQLKTAGEVEITGKNFYEIWKELVTKNA